MYDYSLKIYIYLSVIYIIYVYFYKIMMLDAIL